MNRRELLQMFSAGAIAVPIVSGVPVIGAAAKIVEPPTVEPVSLTEDAPILGSGPFDVTFTRESEGQRFTFTAKAFTLRHQVSVGFDTSLPAYPGFGAVRPFRGHPMEFTIEGYFEAPTLDIQAIRTKRFLEAIRQW